MAAKKKELASVKSVTVEELQKQLQLVERHRDRLLARNEYLESASQRKNSVIRDLINDIDRGF